MNASSFGRILGDFSTHLRVEWRPAPDADSWRLRTDAYEADKDGVPIRGGEQAHSGGAIDGRALVMMSRQGGSGPLIDHVMRMMQKSATQVLELHAMRRMLRRLDVALFAIDHADGHGVEVESGIRELWGMSGANTWAGYASRRAEALTWIDALSNGAPLETAQSEGEAQK